MERLGRMLQAAQSMGMGGAAPGGVSRASTFLNHCSPKAVLSVYLMWRCTRLRFYPNYTPVKLLY